MGLTPLQVCVDSPVWFQGTIPDEIGTDPSSSSPSAITDPILACSRPVMDRRLRPPENQHLKCPRCDSTHTKFCYYNNYSLTQPRYFCKTCRRYWTKGGTLRNIPVGCGCRKNKKVSSSSKKVIIHSQNKDPNPNHNLNRSQQLVMNSTELQLPFPESSMPFSGCNSFGIDFMGGGGGGGEFMGMTNNGGYGMEMGGVNLCSPFGVMTLDSINNPFMERGLNAYDDTISYDLHVKPNLLALEWQDDQTRGATSGGGVTGLGSSWGGCFMGMDHL